MFGRLISTLLRNTQRGDVTLGTPVLFTTNNPSSGNFLIPSRASWYHNRNQVLRERGVDKEPTKSDRRINCWIVQVRSKYPVRQDLQLVFTALRLAGTGDNSDTSANEDNSFRNHIR